MESVPRRTLAEDGKVAVAFRKGYTYSAVTQVVLGPPKTLATAISVPSTRSLLSERPDAKRRHTHLPTQTALTPKNA